MEAVTLGGMAAAPFITALLQLGKGFIPSRFLPLSAVILGVGWNVGLTVGTDEFTRITIFLGIIVGLAASGLYSGVRSVKDEVTERLGGEGGTTPTP